MQLGASAMHEAESAHNSKFELTAANTEVSQLELALCVRHRMLHSALLQVCGSA